MKKTIKTLVVTLAISLSAVTAWAYPVSVDDQVKMYAGDNASIAYEGHYQADNLGDTVGKFGVFCLEKNEYFYNLGTYKVKSIEEYAERGGVSGQTEPGKDYLSYATKWIFSHFMSQDLLTVVTGITAYNLDAEIQDAIWKLEGEYPTTAISGDALKIYTAAQQASGPLAYDVKVMNLVDQCGNFAQSQLVAQPVPEPSTLVLLGVGLAGLGIARRRMKK